MKRKRTIISIPQDTTNWDLFRYHDQVRPDSLGHMHDWGTVDYFLLVYNETNTPWNCHYLVKVLHGILAIDYPIRLKVVYDQDSPKELIPFIHRLAPKAEFLCRPPVPPKIKKRLSCEWGMVWAYNQSDADYVCFNQSDDIPYSNRVYLQIQSLLMYPKAALSLAGKWLVVNGESRQIGYHEVYSRGSPCLGVPSSFMFNKHVLPQFVPQWRQWQKFICCTDIILILEVLKTAEVVAVHYPLFVYNFHGIPVSKTERSADDTLFKQYIKKHQREWDLTRFKYYPPLVDPAVEAQKQLNIQKYKEDRIYFKIWHEFEFSKKKHLLYKQWRKQIQ